MMLSLLVDLGALSFWVIQVTSCAWPSCERSGPLVPPLPAILWQPAQPDDWKSFFPAASCAALGFDGVALPLAAVLDAAFLGGAAIADPATTAASTTVLTRP